jgi:hypothetical protein
VKSGLGRVWEGNRCLMPLEGPQGNLEERGRDFGEGVESNKLLCGNVGLNGFFFVSIG